jgi:hypothetical protein
VRKENESSHRADRDQDPPGLSNRRCATWSEPTRRRAIPFASAHATKILGAPTGSQTEAND